MLEACGSKSFAYRTCSAQRKKARALSTPGLLNLNPAVSYSSTRRPYSNIGAEGLNNQISQESPDIEDPESADLDPERNDESGEDIPKNQYYVPRIFFATNGYGPVTLPRASTSRSRPALKWDIEKTSPKSQGTGALRGVDDADDYVLTYLTD